MGYFKHLGVEFESNHGDFKMQNFYLSFCEFTIPQFIKDYSKFSHSRNHIGENISGLKVLYGI